MSDQKRIRYVQDLELGGLGQEGGSRGGDTEEAPVPLSGEAGAVVASSLMSFAASLTGEARQNVLDSILLAQLASNAAVDATDDPYAWYKHYTRVLQEVGWIIQGRGFTKHEKKSGTLELNKEAIGILEAILSPGKLKVLSTALDALRQVSENSKALTVFGGNAATSNSGMFQLGAADQDDEGNVTLGFGTFYFKTDEHKGRFLFVTWQDEQIGIEFVAEQATLNEKIYAVVKPYVEAKLVEMRPQFVQNLEL